MANVFINVLFKKKNISYHNISSVFKCNISANNFKREYATVKRFYRKTGILKTDGKYEITLDQRKLKTPKGNVFSVDSEPLALAVATEWDMQKEKIIREKMHLTTLCNTVIDNPNNFKKYDFVNYIVNYIDTDTILFQVNDDENLCEFQTQHWDPVIKWFNDKFGTNIEKSIQMEGPNVSQNDKTILNRHMMSHNFASITGFTFAIDTLKSVMLTFACLDGFLSPQKAVYLSRLEEEYQLKHWGRIEWAHDLNQQEMQSRLAAVALFVYCNTEMTQLKSKSFGEKS